MHRLMFAIVLAALLFPAGAAASSKNTTSPKKTSVAWRTYSSKKLGFTLRYPTNWSVLSATGPGNQQVLLSQRTTSYGLTITVLPIGVEPTIRSTLQRYMTYQQQLHNAIFSRIRWSQTSIGGWPAMVGVARSPATEGGITVSDAVYVTQSRSHVYQIVAVSYHRPPLSQLSQFPAIYGQILKTWRFI
jgi:hypothetical protein